jgi:hypothetical protein
MRTTWPLRIVVGSLFLVTFVATVVGLGHGPASATRLMYVGVAATWLAVSLLISERLPGHPIGRVMLGFGGLMAFYLFWDVVIALTTGDPSVAVVAWVISLLDGPLFLLVALLFLLFPTGRPPSPRWRVVVWFDLATAAAVALGSAFKPGPFAYYAHISNPFGIPDFPAIALWEPAYLLLIGSVVLSALSLIGRWRRGGLLERAQLKWVAVAAILVAMAMGGYAVLIGPGKFNDIADLTLGFAFGFFPIAIGIAILRYRLFEIDRLVSRTIAYGVMSAILVAVYGAVILLLQGPLGSVTGGDTIPVAVSTLVAAALFQPLRRRVQSLVDRRFDRARFDSEQTSAAFAERLRADVDIESVTADLRTTVQGALRPTCQGLWIREAME